MGSGEPVLVPEWYRAGNGGKTPNANSDDNGVGLSLRNRLTLNPCDQDSRRSSGRNGSVRSDKNSSAGSRAYSNFGRRDRKKNLCSRDRDRDMTLLSDFDSHDYCDPIVASRTDRDRLWRNDSGPLDRHGDLRPKRLESDSENVGLPRDNVSSGGIRRVSSFKRDFPTLVASEKKGVLDTGRVSNAVQSLPLPSLTTVGGDSWTSALAEVPVVLGGNASTHSSVVQSVPVSSVSRSNSAGLNMAEALIQAPSRVQTPPQLSGDTSRAHELALRQCKQLIPMKPLMPKISGLNSLEKSRLRGATKGGDFAGPPKSSLQLSSQLHVVNNANVPKASQIGNLQVLCRERTGIISSAAKDSGSQGVSLKSSMNPNLKAEIKGTNTSLLSSSKLSLCSFGEKRPLSLAQKRDFFNSLRKKTSVNHSDSASVPEASCCDTMEKSLSLEQYAGSCADVSMINQGENHGNGYCSDASVINLGENSDDSGIRYGAAADTSCVEKQLKRSIQSQSPEDDEEKTQSSCCSDCNCHPAVDLDERDKAFLRSLGWKEDATEEALTAEEIATFIKQYQKLRPYSKFSDRFEAASLSVAQTS